MNDPIAAKDPQELTDLLDRGRKILKAGTEGAAYRGNFPDRLDALHEMIDIGRHLDSWHGEDAARAAEAKSVGRALLQRAPAAALNLSTDILKGTQPTPKELLRLAKALDRVDEFGRACRVLDEARKHPHFGRDPKERMRILQKRALYTYKDVTSPLGTRLNEALDFLETHAGLQTTTDQEALGLAGAIYKRKWELDRNEGHLRRSLEYYEKGYAQKPWQDQGYTAINAAFVLDLLASLKKGTPQAAEEHARAQGIRREIVAAVPQMVKEPNGEWLAQEWFFYATVGEAYFGLGDYDQASKWLVTKPAESHAWPPDWEFETSARQIANLVRAQSGDTFAITPAWEAFTKFLSDSPSGGPVSSKGLSELPDGKFGLALSGGGFRASLFHIGVLARLAELDVLRRIEVLSCVSGGSIIGAHYYLEVRKLLMEKADGAIGKKDYIDIVKRVERDFLAGVQTNIRTNVFTDSRVVRRMLQRDYSRTARLAELYEEQLFAQVADKRNAGAGPARYMHELVIHPMRQDGSDWTDFKPRNHNWRRQAKVPILILNAATLNTGHNWQFTATYMGEAPATIHREVDSIYRLRRKYYTELPDSDENPQKVRLGIAVAASSCVPGLFEPVGFDHMYDSQAGGQPISVKLVDGGVCDNQGVAGLLEQDCTVLLVSDGSGQMDAVTTPSAESLMVALRSNGILQARVRGTQYRELASRVDASMLNGLMFVHLKKDLDNTPVNWRGCPPESRLPALDDRQVNTRYGIPKEVQRRLAAIRTDLDSFCDREAYALMLSGYRMTEHEFSNGLTQLHPSPPTSVDWKFREVEPLVDGSTGPQPALLALLDAGSSLFFKIWQLDPKLQRSASWFRRVALGVGLAAGSMALIALGAFVMAAVSLITGQTHLVPSGALTWLGAGVTVALIGMLALILAAMLLYRRLRTVPQPGDVIAHCATGAVLLVFGCPAARYYMRKYEQPYLQWGKV